MRAWDAFVAASPNGFHTQLTPGPRSRHANGWRSVRVVADGGSGPDRRPDPRCGAIGPGPFGVGYAPRGPIASTWDEASLVAFSAALRRIGTPAAADARHRRAADRGRGGAGDLFEAAGWRVADDVQPRRTWEVPLERPEAELWRDLRSKWRQYVNKARRVGVGHHRGRARRPRDVLRDLHGHGAPDRLHPAHARARIARSGTPTRPTGARAAALRAPPGRRARSRSSSCCAAAAGWSSRTAA